WLDILDAGINIVQLHPETVFRHEKSDMVDIMRAIIELSRGHSESRMKSVRALASWERARERAREGELITRAIPAWVTVQDGLPVLIPERAAVVKRIFELARAGYGASWMAKKFTDEGVPPFGDRVLEEDEEGNSFWQAADGERYGCGQWRSTYIRKILADRRALGEYQPCDVAGKKQGAPISGYFPRVIEDAEFYATRAVVTGRSPTPRRGRIGAGVANLFGGMLRHARDGSTYYVASRLEQGVKRRVLLNKSAAACGARAYTFNFAV